MSILVTGCAGFVGAYVTKALIARGQRVVGIDNLDAYYDQQLKQARLDRLCAGPEFHFERLDLTDRDGLAGLLDREAGITAIVHLAAQAGVRYSLVDPYAYVNANVLGHVTLLEAARRLPRLDHLVYASSSSVYGLNDQLPFRESQRVDRPGSLYAATKRSGELIAHAYGHLFALPQTGLRFFTVYGPWGRPDMAYYAFARAIADGSEITLYEGCGLARDFTYIDDVVDGVLRVLDHPPAAGDAPGRTLNLGNHRSEPVALLVSLLEQALGRGARTRLIPRPATDIEATWASVEAIEALTGWTPKTRLQDGIPRFVAWFRAYHGVV
ncbi:NAD-dependent epimerase/dehydratase family protein [Lichenicoccus sp.]|uniref:NAD-dependent epimerase/dehydratase family protein n=1 Tax=Lichenicoccus sp. TaxID=2781899 RepID=UPI003D145B83